MPFGATAQVAAAAIVLLTARGSPDNLFRELHADLTRLAPSRIGTVSPLGDARVFPKHCGDGISGRRYARGFEGEPIEVSRFPVASTTLYQLKRFAGW